MSRKRWAVCELKYSKYTPDNDDVHGNHTHTVHIHDEPWKFRQETHGLQSISPLCSTIAVNHQSTSFSLNGVCVAHSVCCSAIHQPDLTKIRKNDHNLLRPHYVVVACNVLRLSALRGCGHFTYFYEIRLASLMAEETDKWVWWVCQREVLWSLIWREEDKRQMDVGAFAGAL